MSLEPGVIEDCARLLDEAQSNVYDVGKLTDTHPGIDVDAAYDIQEALRAIKQSRGLRITGMKMGLTSYPKMKQMGVDTPIYGFLSEDLAVDDGGVVEASSLIHPKVEA
jgi:2-oxo-3-hexenedioate decarboxylase